MSLSTALRHPVALFGVAITTVMAILFIVLVMLEFLGFFSNPYVGLLLFVVIPAAFIIGLVLIPIGLRLEARRRRGAPDAPPPDWPVLDFRIARQRRIIAVVVALTCVNLVLLSLALAGAVHYMDSTQFCGQVCHTTMEPQSVAHQMRTPSWLVARRC